MRRFKMSCLITVGLLALPVLVWAIGGNTTAHAKEGTTRKAEKPSTTQTAKKIHGIGELLLVRGISRAEALQLALGSGAKEVVIALWNVEMKTASDTPDSMMDPGPTGIIEYHIINNRVVKTELRIRLGQSGAPESIKGVYNEVKAAGKIDPAKTTKHKVFLTVPLGDKRVLNVEMQEPSAASIYPWFVRFRPGGPTAKSDAGIPKVIAGIRIPVSVSTTEQLKTFLKPQLALLQGIELLDAPISFGQGKVVRSERLSYAIAAGLQAAEAKGAWGVGPGILGKVECRVCEKGQDYKTLMAFVDDIRRRGRVTLSRDSFFTADLTMPAAKVEGKISAEFAISSPKLRTQITKIQGADNLFARIKIGVGPRNEDEDTDTPTTRPAKEKSDK